jgi:uncharacterized protein YggE
VTDASRRDAPRRPGTIVTTGTGRVIVEPDIAELRLGVAISRPTVGEARNAAAEAMTAILQAVSAAGVERHDIRTSTLSVQPRYDYRDGKPPTLTGYDLANVVVVTARDLARLGDVIDGALTAGATSLDGLTFRVDDPRAAEGEARTAAVAEARERAEVLAAAAGVTIAGVHDIVEAGAMPVWPEPKAARAMLAADAGTPVEAGTTEIAVTVTVTFRLA